MRFPDDESLDVDDEPPTPEEIAAWRERQAKKQALLEAVPELSDARKFADEEE